MADTFNIYKGNDKVQSGGSKQEIKQVGSGKEVKTGDFKVTRVRDSDKKESKKVDIQGWKTLTTTTTTQPTTTTTTTKATTTTTTKAGA